MKDLDHKIGSRGDVWILGAQNAGKSSLINSLRRHRALLEARLGRREGGGGHRGPRARDYHRWLLPGGRRGGRLDTPGLSMCISLRAG